MKQPLLIAIACICIGTTTVSCRSNTPVDASEKITIPHDQFLHAMVTKIETAEDGCIAIVRATDGMTYHIAACLSDGGPFEAFKSLQVGDSIHVKGELWMMGEQHCMTVHTFF